MTNAVSPDETRARLPTFYIPHGGGPCFFMEWPGNPRLWDPMAAFLRGMRTGLPARPRAILVISAHWEERVAAITSGAAPRLIYDYSGFPAHTYDLAYPAPGSPALAQRVERLLAANGIAVRADAERGFDHGVFIPFLLVEPEASIPIVQLSLVGGLDPAAHLAIGAALIPLRDEGVLIVGSGMSYHNLGALMGGSRAPGATAFDRWLTESVSADPARRNRHLQAWETAPGARQAHPREEHLLPLMVAAGAAGSDRGTLAFHDMLGPADISAYRFG